MLTRLEMLSMTAAGLVAARTHRAATPHGGTIGLIDKIVKEKLSAAGACAVGVYESGQSIVRGYAQGHPSNAISGETVFGIGSNTKVFTASILASQCVYGRKSLSGHVVRYLPSSVGARGKTIKEITLLELATHTASFPDLIPNEIHETLFVGKPPPADETQSWIDWQNTTSSGNACGGKAPGSCWNYSNWGFITLGYAVAISNSGDVTYPQLLKKVITTPLQLERTGAQIPLGVQGFSKSGTPYKTPPPDLKSNANDMLRFLRANLGALSGVPAKLQRALNYAQQVHWSGSPAPDKMGLAWQLGNPGIIRYYMEERGVDRLHIVHRNDPIEKSGDRGAYQSRQRPPSHRCRIRISARHAALARYTNRRHLLHQRLAVV